MSPWTKVSNNNFIFYSFILSSMGLIYILGFLVFLLVVFEFVLCPLIPITIISTLYISYEALLALAIVFQSILIHLGFSNPSFIRMAFNPVQTHIKLHLIFNYLSLVSIKNSFMYHILHCYTTHKGLLNFCNISKVNI